VKFKLLILLLVTVVMAAAIGPPAQAQTADSTAQNNILFGGGRFTKAVTTGDKFVMSGGVGIHMGKSIYTFAYTDVGHYGSFDFDVAYLFNFSQDLYAGLIAGPNAAWVDNPSEPSSDPILYLAGSSGAIAAYKVVWVYGKYNFAVKDDQTYYQDGWSIGVGLYKLF
jgi:hypothetical protein